MERHKRDRKEKSKKEKEARDRDRTRMEEAMKGWLQKRNEQERNEKEGGKAECKEGERKTGKRRREGEGKPGRLKENNRRRPCGSGTRKTAVLPSIKKAPSNLQSMMLCTTRPTRSLPYDSCPGSQQT